MQMIFQKSDQLFFSSKCVMLDRVNIVGHVRSGPGVYLKGNNSLPHIETSRFSCNANQLTRFCMIISLTE